MFANFAAAMSVRYTKVKLFSSLYIIFSLKHPYEILQNSVQFDVHSVGNHFTTFLDELNDHVSGGRHGVRSQESDDRRVLSSVGNLHGTGHNDIASTEYLVIDILQTFRRIHLYFHVFVYLKITGDI